MASQALVTAATGEPLTLDALKLHLKIEAADSREDGFIKQLLAAARERCEEYQGRAYCQQQWDVWFDAFPWAEAVRPPAGLALGDWYAPGALYLPRNSVLSVEEVSYTQADATIVVVATNQYVTDLSNRRRARVLPATTWPVPAQPLRAANAVKVRYTAGYGANVGGKPNTDAVPARIKLAVQMMVAHWYAHRDGDMVMPAEVERLLGEDQTVSYA